ncbi:MAG: 3'-5' exonuclease [Canibacter sp.]
MSLLIGIDLSTTGTDIDLDRALDVALCVEDPSGHVKFEHLWKIDLPIDLNAKQLKAYGIVISPDSVKASHHRIRSALDEAAQYITCFVKQGGVIVGHNVYFDIGLLSQELKRYELPLLHERVAPLQLHAIDTLRMVSGPGSRSLEHLCAKYEISPIGPFHRSDVDARAAVDLARKLMNLNTN